MELFFVNISSGKNYFLQLLVLCYIFCDGIITLFEMGEVISSCMGLGLYPVCVRLLIGVMKKWMFSIC